MRQLLWQGVRDTLAAEIAAGEYPVGGLLPAQPVLAARFGVSGRTVRTALDAMEQEGLIRKERGKGTFVLAAVPAATVASRLAALEVEVAALRRAVHGPAG